MSFKVKAKHQGQPGQKMAFFAISVACVWFMFGKASLASSFSFSMNTVQV